MSRFLALYICTFSSFYLSVIQGFSERLVTASRPGIGLMFKQVCGWNIYMYVYNIVFSCFNMLLLNVSISHKFHRCTF